MIPGWEEEGGGLTLWREPVSGPGPVCRQSEPVEPVRRKLEELHAEHADQKRRRLKIFGVDAASGRFGWVTMDDGRCHDADSDGSVHGAWRMMVRD